MPGVRPVDDVDDPGVLDPVEHVGGGHPEADVDPMPGTEPDLAKVAAEPLVPSRISTGKSVSVVQLVMTFIPWIVFRETARSHFRDGPARFDLDFQDQVVAALVAPSGFFPRSSIRLRRVNRA